MAKKRDVVRELQDTRAELARLDEQWVGVREVFSSRRKDLRGRIRELVELQPQKPRKRSSSTLSAHQQAGRDNIAKVRRTLERRGPLTQARLCALTGINSGSMTWAIRALIEDGVIRETGYVGRSRQVAMNGKVSTAKPGS